MRLRVSDPDGDTATITPSTGQYCTNRPRGGAGGEGLTGIYLNNYINIDIYSTKNINFIMILVRKNVKVFKKLLKHLVIYILLH
jgi:transcriptional regulator of nitric oxide reductase